MTAAEVLDAARAAVRQEAYAVALVEHQLDDTFLDVVRLLLHAPGKTFVGGAGTSGATARRMAHLLAVTGTPALFLPPGDALHGTAGAVEEGDVVILISKLGGSTEITTLSELVRGRGARVVAITERPESAFAAGADVVVALTTPADADPGDTIAMGSTLMVSAWGDALAQILMRLRGYGWDRFLRIHPAGGVGALESAPEALSALTLDEEA